MRTVKMGRRLAEELSWAKENCGGTVPEKKLNGRTCSEFVRLASSFLNLWTVGFHCSF
jgi:hypothetical protein